MSIKTRIESLEKRLAKPEREETVVRVREIIVHARAEVEQLRAAGFMEPPQDSGRPVPRGPVRVSIDKVVDARDVLADACAAPPQDNGRK